MAFHSMFPNGVKETGDSVVIVMLQKERAIMTSGNVIVSHASGKTVDTPWNINNGY